MNDMPVDSIDSIKRRMIHNASKLWGYPDVQDINSFDPVLSLLIGALAGEVHQVSQEINQSDARIIDKLLEVLFSRNLFSHFPAHALANAKPLQARVTVNEFYRFNLSREVQNGEGRQEADRKNIWFTPAGNYTLFNGEVKYLIAGKNLFQTDGRYKDIIAGVPMQGGESGASLMLGIRLDPMVDLLDGLSLCFSFRSPVDDDRFFSAIHSVNWKINGKKVQFKSGLSRTQSEPDELLANLVKKDRDLSYETTCFVNDFYKKYFITLAANNYHKSDFKTEHAGPNIQGLTMEKHPELFSGEIIWLKAEMFHQFTADEINDFSVSINCFPVINRELNESTHSVVKGTNVIPLFTNDLFFDVARVSDSSNTVFVSRNSVENTDSAVKSYFVRQGGTARFDSRDARETIGHLLDLVRDEAAAFTLKGGDLISFELKQLDQILSRLQQRINTSGITSDLRSYLIVESNTEYDKVSVDFWSIAGEKANNIRPGTKLSVYKGGDINDKSLSLITQSVGGRQKLSKEDKLNKLRRALLSKGRIVTAEDIKALCFEIFGSHLKSAEVKKGVQLESSPGKGLSRTLDVILYLTHAENLSEEELWHKSESLKTRLVQESVNLLPYRIILK
jgi:hypothetical protein